MQISNDTRLIDLTVGELKDIITKSVESLQQPQKNEHFRGISGIAQIFKCSERTASRIKKSGKINGAISQNGRTFVVNADLARELLKINN